MLSSFISSLTILVFHGAAASKARSVEAGLADLKLAPAAAAAPAPADDFDWGDFEGTTTQPSGAAAGTPPAPSSDDWAF